MRLQTTYQAAIAELDEIDSWNAPIVPNIRRLARVLLALVVAGLAGVGPSSAADIEISSSPIRLDGVDAGGRAGTSLAVGTGAQGGTAPSILVGAYLGSATGGGAGYLFQGVSAPGTYLLSDGEVEIGGMTALDRFGYAVSAGGDWNDDGTPDAVFGAWSVDTPAFDSGAVYVFFGGPAFDGSFVADDADVVLTGGDELDHFGWSLDAAHDVNDDGVTDLVVGAPLAQGAGISTGAVYVFFGGTDRTSGTTLSRDDADVTFLGSESESGVGSAVACGNVDGSVPADIAIGAPNRDISGRFNGGAVYLVRGGDALVSGTVRVIETEADRVIIGEGGGDAFGTVVSIALVNDDPDPDVIVGAPLAAVGGDAFRGRTYVFDSPSLPGADIDSGTDAATRLLGESTGDLFGVAVTMTGDMDGDGSREFVVGAPGVSRSDRAGCGAAYMFLGDGGFPPSGSAALADRTYIGAAANDELGESLLGVADFDLDGDSDLVVGAPGVTADAGAIYVIAGDGSPVDVPPAIDVSVVAAPRPNPFRQTVSMQLETERVTAVAVFDAAGRHVRALSVSPSARAVTWDGRDDVGQAASAGVYYVRVEAPAGIQTRSVTLVR